MGNTYELAYIASKTEVRSNLYTDRKKFIGDLQLLTKSGKPMMGQGPDKTGKLQKISRNGWDDDEVVLTAEVNFGTGQKYSYIAGKHYSGMYEILSESGTAIVSVNYRWRQIDDFRSEMWTAGYDEPASFESVLVRRVK